MRRARAAADPAAVVVIAVALHVAFGGGIPANDSWHTLIWGDELASGLVPDCWPMEKPAADAAA